MKVLLPYLKKYKGKALFAPLFKMLEALMDLFVPLVVADLIDVGVKNGDRTYIISRVLLLIALALVALLFSFTAQYFSAKASVGFASDVRQALFDHVMQLSHKQLEDIGSDTLMTRLTSDMNQVQTGLNMALRLLLRSPFIVFGSFIMALTINVKCALVFAVAIPVLLIIVLTIMLVTIPMFKKVQAKLDHLSLLVRENLTGVRVIRAFGKEKEKVEEFDQANDSFTAYNLLTGRITALMNPLTYLLVNLATAVLIYVGAVQVNMGGLLQGQVVALYNYMAQMIVELIKLSSLLITINKALACSQRVADIMNMESDMKYGNEEAVLQEHGTIRFEDVCFAYSESSKNAIDHVSFDVKQGETIGIIGGTGSGKSTLVQLVDRFYDINEGTLFIDGVNIKDFTKQQLRSLIGYVPQKAALFAGTIRDNIKVGNQEASDACIEEALQIAQAKEVVDAKEGRLDYVLEANGRNLSGGQRQRMTIARAVVRKPEILILDDSASALDFATDARLRQSIHTMNHTTVLLVSQRIGTVMGCDQILVLDNGRLAGSGKHEELLQNCSVYREIYESQFPERKEEKR